MEFISKKRLFVTGHSVRQSNGKTNNYLLCSDGSSNASLYIKPDMVSFVKPMLWADVTVITEYTERFGLKIRIANIEYCEGGVSDDSHSGS